MWSLAQVKEPPETGFARVVEIDVALVEEQIDATLVGEVDDALEVFAGDDGAGGVRGRIENDRLGARGDGGFDGVGGDAEVFGLTGFEEDNLAAGVLNDVFEADPVGDRQDHFVAVIDEDLERVEERVLSAGREDGFVDAVVRTEVAGVPLDDGFAHVGDAGNDGVAREVGLDGDDGSVLNMARRGKVRFARTEVDEVDALGAQFGGLGGDGHGSGDFNAADAIGEDFGGSDDGHDVSILADFWGWGKPGKFEKPDHTTDLGTTWLPSSPLYPTCIGVPPLFQRSAMMMYHRKPARIQTARMMTAAMMSVRLLSDLSSSVMIAQIIRRSA